MDADLDLHHGISFAWRLQAVLTAILNTAKLTTKTTPNIATGSVGQALKTDVDMVVYENGYRESRFTKEHVLALFNASHTMVSAFLSHVYSECSVYSAALIKLSGDRHRTFGLHQTRAVSFATKYNHIKSHIILFPS